MSSQIIVSKGGVQVVPSGPVGPPGPPGPPAPEGLYVTQTEFDEQGPSGRELAYVENITETSVSTSGTNLTPVDMTGMLIVVPASVRPVWLRLYISCFVVPAAMNVYLTINEVDNGVDTPVDMQGIVSETGAIAGRTVTVEDRLGPTARDRTFKASWQKQGSGAASAVTANGHKVALSAFER